MRGWAIHRLFKSVVLGPWLELMVKDQNIEMILLLSLLNFWVSPFLSDTSSYGLNSYSDESSYFRDMANGTPYIIDFILDSPIDLKIAGVTDVLSSLYQLRLKTQEDFSLSEGMEFHYRASFLAWLVKESSPLQRNLARKLLSHIMRAQASAGFSIRCMVCWKDA